MIAGSDLIDSMPRLLIQILLDHGQRVFEGLKAFIALVVVALLHCDYDRL